MPALSTIALIVSAIAAILRQIAALPFAGTIAAAALLIYLAIELRALSWPPRVMLLASVILAAASLSVPDPASLLAKAFDRATLFTTLATVLAFLREAAQTSPLVKRAGDFLIRQPPGRRYAVLTSGSHLIGLVLNFGVLNLLGTMVARSNTLDAAGGRADILAIRQRRMNLALLRGFAAGLMWSPLSVALAVVLAAVPQVRWYDVVPLGVVTSMLFMALGYAMDRVTVPKRLRGRAPPMAPSTDVRSVILLAALVGGVMAVVIAVSTLFALSLIAAVMMVAPLFAIGWIVAQHAEAGAAGALRLAAERLRTRLVHLMPDSRTEVVMLGGAGFVGTVLAGLISPAAVAEMLRAASLPPILLLVLVPWAVVLGGQLGVAPIVTVAVLGAALPDPAAFGLNPVLVAVGFLAAWGLTTGSTAIAAATLIVGRLNNVSAGTVGRVWNGAYTMLGLGLLAVWLIALNALL